VPVHPDEGCIRHPRQIAQRTKGWNPANLIPGRMYRPDRPGKAHLCTLLDHILRPARSKDGNGPRTQQPGESACHACTGARVARLGGLSAPPEPAEDISEQKMTDVLRKRPPCPERGRMPFPVTVIGVPACTTTRPSQRMVKKRLAITPCSIFCSQVSSGGAGGRPPPAATPVTRPAPAAFRG
jgi:hypothetical protein